MARQSREKTTARFALREAPCTFANPSTYGGWPSGSKITHLEAFNLLISCQLRFETALAIREACALLQL